MTTFTKRTTSIMVHDKDLINSLSILNNEGLLLLPTDTIWSIGCDATDEVATRRLLNISNQDHSLEILVDSIEMLRQYVDHLHPRIETLLSFHARPLSIVFKKFNNLAGILQGTPQKIAFRVCQDTYCKQIISSFGRPILTTKASLDANETPQSFGNIRSDVFSKVDYISKFRQGQKAAEMEAVMVEFDDDGELYFIRE